jgi:hypothetical protein
MIVHNQSSEGSVSATTTSQPIAKSTNHRLAITSSRPPFSAPQIEHRRPCLNSIDDSSSVGLRAGRASCRRSDARREPTLSEVDAESRSLCSGARDVASSGRARRLGLLGMSRHGGRPSRSEGDARGWREPPPQPVAFPVVNRSVAGPLPAAVESAPMQRHFNPRFAR